MAKLVSVSFAMVRNNKLSYLTKDIELRIYERKTCFTNCWYYNIRALISNVKTIFNHRSVA